jgi:SAM-dependent methyltransferase
MKDESTPFERITACPACAGKRLRSFRKGTYFERLTQEQIKITDSQYGKIWALSLCLDCGHLFADPCPSPEHIFALYGRVEDPVYEEEAGGRARNFATILDRLEKWRPEKGRLFDVGAATGILLDLARRRGFEPDGIELSRWAVQVAAEKYRLRVREGAFESAALDKGRYAAVTMIDFIEHTPTPFPAAKKAYEILEPGGIMALVTPDIHSLAARFAGRRWWHLRPAHLAFFSGDSLAALLGRAGFSIIEERRYSWTFSLHYLISRKSAFDSLLRVPALASFLKRIRLKLALRDSFEIYARKDGRV